MNAVEYLKIKERLCKNATCIDCPLNHRNNGLNNTCGVFEKKHPDQAVEIVENWSKEHPVKTYLSVLLEKFPNVKLDEGIPTTCPYHLFNIDNRKCPSLICVKCWNREYKEEI
jgi:hypothetical protein